MSYKYFESSHVAKRHKLKLEDTTSQFIIVPCKKYNVIISNIPKQNSNDTIYGFVEHYTDLFYYQNKDTFIQLRNGLKFYFKATKEELKLPLDLDVLF